MLPKAFLVDDLGYRVGELAASLADTRKRLERSQRQIESQKRAIEALRKRMLRSATKRGSAPPVSSRWTGCSTTTTMP
jgi:hypothetical protein